MSMNMNMNMNIKRIALFFFSLILFCLGINVVVKYSNIDKREFEPFNSNYNHSCENLLIKKGDKYHLKNTRIPKSPGVNPIIFDHLEDYISYMEQQREKGKICPVLFLENVSTTQGTESKKVYSINHDTSMSNGYMPGLSFITDNIEMERNLNADSEHNPWSFEASDPSRYTNGLYTNTDAIYHSNEKISPNPMDSNWGGVKFTRDMIESGEFNDDIVTK